MSYNIDINTGHLRDFNLPAMSYIHVWIIFLSAHLNEQTFTTELNRSEDVRYESQNTNTLELLKLIW